MEVEPLGLGGNFCQSDRARRHLHRIEGVRIKFDLAGFELREIQDFIDHPQKRLPAIADTPDLSADFIGKFAPGR